MQETVKSGAVAAAVKELPNSENFAYFQYEQFKNLFELDVVDTLEKDLLDEKAKEMQLENTYIFEQ